MQNNSKLFISLEMVKSFLSIIFATIVFNFFISGILNTNNQIKTLKNTDFISAELQNNLSLEQKKDLEIKLLNIPEIKKVTYIDSFIAFQNLQNDLGIVLPHEENPLPDSLRIYVKNLNNFEKIQEILDSTQEIKEYFLDTTYSDNINRKIKFFDMLSIILTISTSFIGFIVITIASMQFKIDYVGTLINFGYTKNTIFRAKTVNLLPFTFAILAGEAISFNIYFLIRRWLISSEICSSVLTLSQVLMTELLLNFVLIGIIWILPVKERWENE
ncbi:permease-like cell division protein FtsX [Fusobacterium sp.]|uniref:permease-like cell division protein FtsX n=1 Tax=Fusobacterium sp. TaxID=68766 RepID=UPI0026042C1F|nr:permease-like cell division protein FtsX [Fusobacterium sp.]